MKKRLGILSLVFALGLMMLSVQTWADTAAGNVTIANTAPTMGAVTLWNEAGADGAISPTVSSITVTANATITDVNGGGDIISANATLYHSTSTSGVADDENTHITNSSCALGATVGDTKVVTCSFTMNFMALNGTWTANVTAVDASAASVSAIDDNTVSTLAGLEVVESTINMGSLALGANSSSAATMTVRSQGNIQIDARFSGDGYTCTSGTIPVGNTRYSLVTGNYDSMSTPLSAVVTTQDAFNLGVRGVATADGAPSEMPEYWTILIPTTGVSGTCTNTITVTGISG